jgi:hypothetical protein
MVTGTVLTIGPPTVIDPLMLTRATIVHACMAGAAGVGVDGAGGAGGAAGS